MFLISTMANVEPEVYELLKLFDLPGYNDVKISSCFSTPKLAQAHDSAVSLTIFYFFLTTRLPISWFLGKCLSKRKCFFV